MVRPDGDFSTQHRREKIEIRSRNFGSSARAERMQYEVFIKSLDYGACPGGLDPGLRALWYDAKGAWDTAHEIVQARGDDMASRIHAYLHRKEGDEGNAHYWHRRAGTVFPEDLSLEAEWEALVRELTE